MARSRRIDRDPDAPVVATAVITLVCGLFAAFLLAVSADITWNGVRDVRAAYGGHGPSGTVTVTELRKRSGRGSDTCIATFRPDTGGPPLEGVRVHMDGPCEIGRTEEDARLVEGEELIFSMGGYDRAFVDGNAGLDHGPHRHEPLLPGPGHSLRVLRPGTRGPARHHARHEGASAYRWHSPVNTDSCSVGL